MYSKSLDVKMLLDTTGVRYDNYSNFGDIVWHIDTLIKTCQDWIKFEFSFIAQGGEMAFMLGNFNGGSTFEYEFRPGLDTSNQAAAYTYWYVDNFSLTEIPDTLVPPDTIVPPTPPILFSDNLTIANNPGGASIPTVFTATLNKETTAKLTVFDEAGRIIVKHVFAQDAEKYILENLAGAVYFYVFESSNGVKLKGKVVQF